MADQTKKNQEKEPITVNEAGRRGGETTSERHGREFYEEIGHKGGQRVRELIEEGKEREEESQKGRDSSSHKAA